VTKGGKSLAKKVVRIYWKLLHEIEFSNPRGGGGGGFFFFFSFEGVEKERVCFSSRVGGLEPLNI